MRTYAVYANKNDGLGWVRAFKRTYQTPEDANKAAKRYTKCVVVCLKNFKK